MAGRGCNLECVKGDDAGKDIIEFMGPVKIILVDQPKNLYMRKRFAAAAIVLAHMMMGATSMTVLYYTLSYQKDSALFASHIVLGTAGLQLCMPSGILALHKLAGSTAVLRLPHRPFEHFWLQCFAIICGVLSALASFFFGDFKITVHSVTGVAATSIAILNAIFGIIVYDYSGTRIDHTELAEAILSLNYANGWSTPMRLRHRRLAHTLLQMCAMALAITGTVLITIDKGLSSSPHGLTVQQKQYGEMGKLFVLAREWCNTRWNFVSKTYIFPSSAVYHFAAGSVASVLIVLAMLMTARTDTWSFQ
ncbi:unnamed protein product [Pieris brassicae]|uniref:ascorbate ferrireductase (transmembrane) n=1 Tax=Pieris brassicae TaxID=7116 RepID=A0A9P0TSP4_PIEBR|nr:unnamed protein product [Pieris brassicae]